MGTGLFSTPPYASQACHSYLPIAPEGAEPITYDASTDIASIALDGEPDRGPGADYDWKEAGCRGYAVHVTGIDNAN